MQLLIRDVCQSPPEAPVPLSPPHFPQTIPACSLRFRRGRRAKRGRTLGQARRLAVHDDPGNSVCLPSREMATGVGWVTRTKEINGKKKKLQEMLISRCSGRLEQQLLAPSKNNWIYVGYLWCSSGCSVAVLLWMPPVDCSLWALSLLASRERCFKGARDYRDESGGILVMNLQIFFIAILNIAYGLQWVVLYLYIQ